MFPSGGVLFGGEKNRETVLDLKLICFSASVLLMENTQLRAGIAGFLMNFIKNGEKKKKTRVNTTVIFHQKCKSFVSTVCVKCKHCHFLFKRKKIYSL